MRADELKQYIIDNNCVPQILESLHCHDISEHLTEWRSALPNGRNKTAVCVKKENLSIAIRSSEIEKMGDIYTLVMELQHCNFSEANKFLHRVLGLKFTYKQCPAAKPKEDPLYFFKKVKRSRSIVNEDMPVYDETCLKEYINLPHISWIREGIMPFVCERFHIGFSYDRKRIIIPWRNWCGEENDYLGIVGRTVIPNYDMLDIPKYFGIVPFQKGQTLYGLYENYKDIQEAGYVIVYESEKSVLKRCSRLDNTGVAIGSHILSERQVQILISLNVEIIIALDEGLDINLIRKECDKFYGIRKVSYVYDKWGLIPEGSKNSPADANNKICKFLFKHRILYDDYERGEYKRWQDKLKKH